MESEKLGDVKDPGKNEKQMTAAHKRTSIANTAANVMEIEGLPFLIKIPLPAPWLRVKCGGDDAREVSE